MGDKLTAENVDKIFQMCLFQEAENLVGAVVVECIVRKFGFHPIRIKQFMPEISKLLNQLPDDFMDGKGGGMSFLNMCLDKDGNQWGEHFDMEKLLALGLANGLARFTLSRDMWEALPHKMPYLTIYQPKDIIDVKFS